MNLKRHALHLHPNWLPPTWVEHWALRSVGVPVFSFFCLRKSRSESSPHGELAPGRRCFSMISTYYVCPQGPSPSRERPAGFRPNFRRIKRKPWASFVAGIGNGHAQSIERRRARKEPGSEIMGRCAMIGLSIGRRRLPRQGGSGRIVWKTPPARGIRRSLSSRARREAWRPKPERASPGREILKAARAGAPCAVRDVRKARPVPAARRRC